MRYVIVLNGDKINDFTFKKDDFIIACDGGYKYLQEKGISPNLILGDFDSLGYIPKGASVYPCDKDLTDGEIAIDYAIKNGAKHVEIICAGGGREDHFLGNLSLLVKAEDSGISACIRTLYSTVYYTKVGGKFESKKGSTVSIIPQDIALISWSKNLKFEYKNLELTFSKTLGLSNKATANSFEICVEKGGVFVFVNNL